MRISILIIAGLLVTGCDGRSTGTAGETTTGMLASGAENDAAGAFAEKPPTAAQFVQRVAMSDMYEIRSGKQAAEHANIEETRAFGQMMATDHSGSNRKLQAAVQQSGQSIAMPSELDGEHQAMVDILDNLNDDNFDREYMNQQLAAHRKTLELLKGYAAHGDNAALRQFAQQAIPGLQQHHDQLERYAAGLPGSATMTVPVVSGSSSQ